MIKMISKSELESLDFADVLLVPKHTDVFSRDDINFYVGGKGHHPVFCSPMKGIATPELITQLSYLGGVGLLHRFFETQEERYEAVDKISEYAYTFGVSIGINNWEDELNFVHYAYKHGAEYVVLDVANGNNQRTISATKELYNYRYDHFEEFEIITGNVVTLDGALKLAEAGANFIRVGIGSGGLCSTSNYTGIGMPMLTAIQDCAKVKTHYPDVKIIADGGIKSSGEAMKAFVWGGDWVMCGSLFGRAKEANNNGVMYGMSSSRLQKEMNKIVKSNEGLIREIPREEIKPLKEIYNEFVYNIKSGLSYLNVDDINKIHQADIQYIRTGNGTLKNL
jgi:IMP dehydrogenase